MDPRMRTEGQQYQLDLQERFKNYYKVSSGRTELNWCEYIKEDQPADITTRWPTWTSNKKDIFLQLRHVKTHIALAKMKAVCRGSGACAVM